MSIIDIFESLTRKTVPSGLEADFAREFLSFCSFDDYGNAYYQIGDSRSAFCAHIDDVSPKVFEVERVFDGRFFSTTGQSILGADDKAGVAVLLYLIEVRKPGRYFFFVREEEGHLGSKAMKIARPELFAGLNKILSIDRKGYSSIVYRQGGITASPEFARELSNSFCERGMFLNPDDTGISSDAAVFSDRIAECVNLSAGYFKAHSPREICDMKFLEKLAFAISDIDFDSLPSFRTPAP